MDVVPQYHYLKAKHHRESPRQAVERYRKEWNQDANNEGNYLQQVMYERMYSSSMVHVLRTVELHPSSPRG